MKLNDDTTNTDVSDTTNGQLIIEPQYLKYLREHGYHIDGVEDVRIVPSSSRDLAHVVAKVYTYALPHGHEDLDVSADRREITVCSCEDYTYNQSVDVSETALRDGTLGECRHITGAFRVEKARADDQQTELGE